MLTALAGTPRIFSNKGTRAMTTVTSHTHRAFACFMAITVGLATSACASAAAAPEASKGPAWEAFPIAAVGPAKDAAKKNVVVIDAGGTLTARARDRIS